MGNWNPGLHPRRPNIWGRNHGVATGHYLATQAGFTILEAGGNAIDAGVCAGITINVLESQQCSFSGVAPMVIYLRDKGELVTIDGLGTWPAAMTPAFFQENGYEAVPKGILQSVVSAAPAAWIEALLRYGTMSFAEVAAKAVEYAKDGFPLHAQMAHTLVQREPEFPSGTEAHRIFFPNGRTLVAGEIFQQPDLGRSLQYMIDEEAAARVGGREAGLRAARAAFYEGDLARAFVKHQRENGGFLTEADFKNYQVTIERPLLSDFGQMTVASCGPWCQGPMLLQQLSILNGIDLKAKGHNSADYVHAVVEAIKLSAADRDRYYGDPKFTDVPMEWLLSDQHASDLRAMIGAKALPFGIADVPTPEGSTPANAYLDTTYVCAVDKAGNAFSATPSDGVMHLSPVVPGTGMAVSPRGIQSRTDPNHPSSVAPGKRPRLTPNPAMAFRGRDFVMPFGTPGGDLQTQAMLQTVLNMEVFGMTAQAAIEAPRFYSYGFPDSFAPHPIFPNLVRIEDELGCEAELTRRGHVIERWPDSEWPITSMCAVAWDHSNKRVEAAADYRRTGYGLAG